MSPILDYDNILLDGSRTPCNSQFSFSDKPGVVWYGNSVSINRKSFKLISGSSGIIEDFLSGILSTNSLNCHITSLLFESLQQTRLQLFPDFSISLGFLRKLPSSPMYLEKFEPFSQTKVLLMVYYHLISYRTLLISSSHFPTSFLLFL